MDRLSLSLSLFVSFSIGSVFLLPRRRAIGIRLPLSSCSSTRCSSLSFGSSCLSFSFTFLYVKRSQSLNNSTRLASCNLPIKYLCAFGMDVNMRKRGSLAHYPPFMPSSSSSSSPLFLSLSLSLLCIVFYHNSMLHQIFTMLFISPSASFSLSLHRGIT